MFAPRFSQNYACHAKDTPAIALTLESGHYKLLLPPKGTSIPQRWMLHTETPDREKLKGAGGSKATSCRSKCTSVVTPSVYTCSIKDKQDTSSVKTPTVYSPKFAAIPQPAKSKHRVAVSRTHVSMTSGASPQQPDVSTATCGKRKRLQELDLERSQVQAAEETSTNRVDSFQWTCNLCDQVFRGKFLKSIECSRRRHIAKAHPKQGHLVNMPARRKHQIVEPSVYIPEDQRMWTCTKCSKGFPYMSQGALKRNKEAHLTKCYGMTLKKLRSLKYNSLHWKAHHKKLVQDNAKKKRDKNDQRIQEHNKECGACLFRIPAFSKDWNSSNQFSCAKCTVVFQKLKDAMQHICPGHKGRVAVIQNQSRRRLWAKLRKTTPETVHHLVKNWKLTHEELKILEKGLPIKGGRNGVVPASKSTWYADLTQHGDVEPNPGPQSITEPTWSGCMANVAGKENCWSFVRYMIQHKHDIAIVQEHRMNVKEQADMAKFCLRHKYRSWFVAPPERTNEYGRAYTTGGVAIFVKAEKRCHEINKHVDDSGQAIMLQIDQAFVVGAYIPPRQEESNAALVKLDEWTSTLAPHRPLILMGDFNKEPAFASRWTSLARTGAARFVTDDLGVPLPTRWGGKRCIDWAWASHAHLLKNLQHDDTALSDHKIFKFCIRHDQASVRTYKQIPTCKLEKPNDIDAESWSKAMEEAWKNVPSPEIADTQSEWMAFCNCAVEAYDRALSSYDLPVSHKPQVSRPKGSLMKVQRLRPKTYRLTQSASFRELKLRKLLGKVKEAIFQHKAGREVPGALIHRIWNHPLVKNNTFQNFMQIQKWAEDELQKQIQAEKLARLQEWRACMRSDLAAARQWVKRDNTLPINSVFDQSFLHGKASDSNQESLKAIASFWNQIWNREKPEANAAFDFWQQQVPAQPTLQWEPLTAFELYGQAIRQKHAAGGPDGLAGNEVAQWPIRAWQILEELLQRWQVRSEIPQVWSSVKQVHLQKPGAKLRADGAIGAKDLRPISVQCVVWRIIASSFTRRETTRRWIKSWAHPTACGGIAGKGVAQAIDALLQQFEKPAGGILVSLDFQKAFDTVNPQLGLMCLKHLGMPEPMLVMLRQVWQQQRWLNFQGEFLSHPIQVSASLPQGDACSPLTLLALMTGLTKHIMHNEPQPFDMITYLDDRNFIARNVPQAIRLWQSWRRISAQLGLWEHNEKVKIVPRKASLRDALLNGGFAGSHLVSSTRVLGIDFAARLGSLDKPTQKQRLSETRSRLDRIQLLPISHQKKSHLIASIAIPKAVWGAWTKIQPVTKLTPQVMQIAGAKHKQTSQHLFFLLAGHGLHPEFAAGAQAYTNLASVVRQKPRPWPNQSGQGTWLGTVRKFLKSLGWVELGNWQWRHPSLRPHANTINWNIQINKDGRDLEAHLLRESWRQVQFASFKQSSRRDAAQIQAVSYDENRTTMTRRFWRTQDAHGRGVLAGAIVSDARFDIMQGKPIACCQWCRTDALPDWSHLAWHCNGFRATRAGLQVPHDNLQRILGWPVGGPDDKKILEHLAGVRKRLLDWRYRSM